MSEALPLFKAHQTLQDALPASGGEIPPPNSEAIQESFYGPEQADRDRADLRAILIELRNARFRHRRDQIFKLHGNRITEIIGRQPDLLQPWLLAVDQVNKGFRSC